MRWSALISVALLACSGVFLPGLLSRGLGMKPGDTTRMVKSVHDLRSAETAEANMEAQFQSLLHGRPPQGAARMPAPGAGDGMRTRVKVPALQGASDAQRKVAMAKTIMDEFKNQEPVSRKMARGAAADWNRMIGYYAGVRSTVLPALVLLAGVFALAGALGLISALRGLARFLLTMAFTQAGYFLMLVSIAALLYFVMARINIWPVLPLEAVAAPIGYMVVCGACLRVLDPNVPIWNTMMRSMVSPVLSSVAVTALAFALPAKAAALAGKSQ